MWVDLEVVVELITVVNMILFSVSIAPDAAIMQPSIVRVASLELVEVNHLREVED